MMDSFENSKEKLYFSHGKSNRNCMAITAVLAIIIGFIIGILIGRFATCPEPESSPKQDGVFLPGVPDALIKDGDPAIGDILINDINSDNIRGYLRKLSGLPHLAGTDADLKQAQELKEFFLEKAGLDSATITPYKVLLSYPNMSNLNYVELLNSTGGTYKRSDLREPPLTHEENKTGVVPPFNAYSAPGDVTGDLVYVNYGRVEDYNFLENNRSINVSGKLVLARYGKIFRGDKVHHAETHGAKGIIIFSDPADYTNGDTSRVYPHTWWLPGSGAQRGTVYIGDGDPLTPDYPAISSAYREDENETEFYLPRIPAHPIGYDIAKWLLDELAGEEVPPDWRGGIQNITYRYGGTFNHTNWKVRIHISTSNQMRTTYNTFGIIRGQVEPDRYVLIGNHRDAWVFGALDPSSGTATMMEIARAMGKLVKDGKWRPRRSVVFCSWGSEEYGLLGSTEWIEEYTKTLGARAVAYLNVDIAVQGNHTLRSLGTPLMYQSVYAATKRVPNPNQDEIDQGRPTVYDTWLDSVPWKGYGKPKITLPGSGSDYAPFRDRIGIPVVDIRYTYDSRKYNISSYPLYHSAYETFYAVDKIMDKGFTHHKAVGQVWVEMARNLADSLILPFDVSDYSWMMENMRKTLFQDYESVMKNRGIKTDDLTSAIEKFTAQVEQFQTSLQKVNRNDPLAVRRINDQLMQLDRAFIDPEGLPSRRLKRHILFAESSINNYAGSSFPGLVDSLFEIDKAPDQAQRWKVIKKHFSVILFTIQSAAATLKDVTDFMYDYA